MENLTITDAEISLRTDTELHGYIDTRTNAERLNSCTTATKMSL